MRSEIDGRPSFPQAPVTVEKANAMPSGGGGKHAVIAGGNENPIVGPGMNLGAHGAL